MIEADTFLMEKIQVLEIDFKSLHEDIIDSIDIEDEGELERESRKSWTERMSSVKM